MSKQEHFIPYKQQDIVQMIFLKNDLTIEQESEFNTLCEILTSLYHHRFHSISEKLKYDYLPFNPDRDTRILDDSTLEESQFSSNLNELLKTANYRKISQSDLNAAFREESLFKIRLHVDFGDFKEVLLFFRGESEKKAVLESWFGFRKREITFTNYDRVVLYLEFEDSTDSTMSDLPNDNGTKGTKLLKLFRNVPKADLEMLFPNTQVRMKLIDKILIGLPAVVSGGVVVSTKLGATLVLMSSLQAHCQ